MSRPESHRELAFEKSCQNCRHCLYPAGYSDALCFKGDVIEIPYFNEYPTKEPVVMLDGEHIDLLDGDARDRVWGGRVLGIPGLEVCDEWEALKEEPRP